MHTSINTYMHTYIHTYIQTYIHTANLATVEGFDPLKGSAVSKMSCLFKQACMHACVCVCVCLCVCV